MDVDERLRGRIMRAVFDESREPLGEAGARAASIWAGALGRIDLITGIGQSLAFSGIALNLGVQAVVRRADALVFGIFGGALGVLTVLTIVFLAVRYGRARSYARAHPVEPAEA
ncbi:hypothetical protein [Schumannella sp. 10F1B-5-1]|uniref:hypothetical protein n=1 Tax=Schumannella sp. 10F1B-5-1 TaxID=2590780 RepID=UPI00113036E4|nr:hypothetical protein [Schumannella sp. 10F1B-5-1]TPW71633.1 hypothetical protein FJ658_09780 [Schumannella sp. 10F1B-5-1]